MTFTDNGTKVKHDWLPLAAANGIEWMGDRYGYRDRFDNLYRRKLGLNGALWYVGALCQYCALRFGGNRWIKAGHSNKRNLELVETESKKQEE